LLDSCISTDDVVLWDELSFTRIYPSWQPAMGYDKRMEYSKNDTRVVKFTYG